LKNGLYASMWNRQREAEEAREKLARTTDEAAAPNRNPPVLEEPPVAPAPTTPPADIPATAAE
jgi:hypothetical protein